MAIAVLNGGGSGQLAGVGNGGDIATTLDPVPLEDQYILLAGGHSSDNDIFNAGPEESGYTIIFNTAWDNGADSGDWGAWYKKMTSTPDTVVTGLGSGNTRHATVYGALLISGADLTTFLDVATTFATPSGDYDPPSITPVTDGSLLLIGAADFDDTNLITGHPDAGYTDTELDATITDSVRFMFGMANKILATAAATDPAAFGQSATPSDPRTFHIAIRPAAGGAGLSIPVAWHHYNTMRRSA